jgi:fumarate hydratase class I
MSELVGSLLQLVMETATNLPDDVREVTQQWRQRELAGTLSAMAVDIICRNVDRARAERVPICQDTGMPTFWVRCPRAYDQEALLKAIHEAVATATQMGVLRPNSVDSLTGRNAGLNLGPGTPVVHFEQHATSDVEIMLLLKGGGCENQSAQYSLPCELRELGRADRDLEGVYRCVMDALQRAQGHGCSAGFIGVCIGSDRAEGYAEAKRQLLRHAMDRNPVPELDTLEQRVMEAANKLGIGTMGFGGNVTLLGCKIGALNRIPASYYVSVAYNCWAYRRLGVVLDAATGAIKQWKFRAEAPPDLASQAAEVRPERVRTLRTPISEAQARELKAGDLVMVSGVIHTARDAMHKYMVANPPPSNLEGGLIYHCGPVVIKDERGEWCVKAAGPTTSIREEPYEADVLRKVGARAVCGKGGMGIRTLEALQEVGAVYLNAIGGAAAYYAERIVGVEAVYMLEEFGVPEAMWRLRVGGFPAIVTMDSHGNSLHRDVEESSSNRLRALGEE